MQPVAIFVRERDERQIVASEMSAANFLFYDPTTRGSIGLEHLVDLVDRLACFLKPLEAEVEEFP